MAVYVEAGQNFAVNCIRDLLFAGLSAGLVPELLCLRPGFDKLSLRDRTAPLQASMLVVCRSNFVLAQM